jgi:hypothetical protein
MPPLDLNDDEQRALLPLPRRTIDFDPCRLLPRLAPLKAILAKLEPLVLQADPGHLLRPTGHRPGAERAPRKRQRAQ